MKKEIVFIDDDTLTPDELQMISEEWEVDIISPIKTEEMEDKNEQQTEKQE